MEQLNITEPLILSRGSHEAGSGRGCAMNVVSWELGESIITDKPGGVDSKVAQKIWELNDSLAFPTEKINLHRVYADTSWYCDLNGIMLPPPEIAEASGFLDALVVAYKTGDYTPIRKHLEGRMSWGELALYERAPRIHRAFAYKVVNSVPFEVPAAYSVRLIELAHMTLTTVGAPLEDIRDRDTAFLAIDLNNLNDLMRRKRGEFLWTGAPLALTTREEVVVDRAFDAVEVYLRSLKQPERLEAPSLGDINEAIRNMSKAKVGA